MIPRYNPIQKILNRVFYSPQKSVFIFTEDKPGDKLFYEILLKRLNNPSFTIEKVQPLGPKSEVIEKSIQDKKSKTPTLYIVDGDIKLMFGDCLENKNLISLDRYCIENYLCCESGIVDYLVLKTGFEESKVKAKLQFSSFMNKNGKLVLNYYHHLAISFQLGCGIGFKNSQAFTKGAGQHAKIDKTLVDNEIAVISTAIINKLKSEGIKAYRKTYHEKLKDIRQQNNFGLQTILKVLSGKDILLPLIKHRIDFVDPTSRVLSKEQIKRILAEKVSMEPLAPIKRKITSLL